MARTSHDWDGIPRPHVSRPLRIGWYWLTTSRGQRMAFFEGTFWRVADNIGRTTIRSCYFVGRNYRHPVRILPPVWDPMDGPPGEMASQAAQGGPGGADR